jgi:hypothetical protein
MKAWLINAIFVVIGVGLGAVTYHTFVPPKTIIHNVEVEVVKEVAKDCPIAPSCPLTNPPLRGILTEKEFKWQVPDDTRSVTVRILEKNGRLINEYEISRFISIKPGQKLHLLSK